MCGILSRIGVQLAIYEFVLMPLDKPSRSVFLERRRPTVIAGP